MSKRVERSAQETVGGKRESSTEEPKTLAITDLRGPDLADGPHLRL